ncbi:MULTISPECIES: hypothetical protein [Clostridium]|uniref:Uncharacterized protein n=1 Tax=Clostridium frigoriphilum TaxID=443253 RepID=A0ABU7UPA4_9CLOT|nr:hypothetical protein [Clostridium sp. DSM 17811]MBU3100256.1 hypothetical protein [Clostridium sp. DSM 17811]
MIILPMIKLLVTIYNYNKNYHETYYRANKSKYRVDGNKRPEMDMEMYNVLK